MLGKVLLHLFEILMVILLFRFRKNDFMTKKVVEIFGQRIELNGKDENPLTKIFGDGGSGTKSLD
jgi:hypothetical protein